MKSTLFVLALCALLVSCSSNQTVLNIPAGHTTEIDYPNYDLYKVSIKNQSLNGLDVAVLSKDQNNQVRGFGLGTKARADVMVESSNKLVFKNTNDSDISLRLGISEAQPMPAPAQGTYISFTLRNTTAQSIPLLIPTVMNPNLSPFSRSGVDLKVGQEILFREKGKKYVLLTVDESIQPGDEIDVAKVLKARRKELGLSK